LAKGFIGDAFEHGEAENEPVLTNFNMITSKHIAFMAALAATLNLVSLMPARGTINVVSYWRMGEQDPGAAPGITATNAPIRFYRLRNQ
jgi:hypothetical protein